jgi:hypothetical protein
LFEATRLVYLPTTLQLLKSSQQDAEYSTSPVGCQICISALHPDPMSLLCSTRQA